MNLLIGFVVTCDEKLNKEQLSKIKSSLEEVTEVICVESTTIYTSTTKYAAHSTSTRYRK
jgi:hypothetical protein